MERSGEPKSGNPKARREAARALTRSRRVRDLSDRKGCCYWWALGVGIVEIIEGLVSVRRWNRILRTLRLLATLKLFPPTSA